MRIAYMLTLALPVALTGCIARTAVDIVTLPVKAASAGVDAVTTSQSEADRNRGRAIRKQEEQEDRDRRRALKEEQQREREAPRYQ